MTPISKSTIISGSTVTTTVWSRAVKITPKDTKPTITQPERVILSVCEAIYPLDGRLLDGDRLVKAVQG